MVSRVGSSIASGVSLVTLSGMNREIGNSGVAGSGNFATTQWSVVLRAGGKNDPSSAAALADLCRAYWYPLYAYARRRTGNVHTAQDLTQDFFASIVERNTVALAVPERGKFRAFLLTSLRNFLANAHERNGAQKRGGRHAPLSFDFDAGESRWSLEPTCDETPERVFERDWALALLDAVLQRLRAEFVAAGKERQWELLQPTLTGGRSEGFSYADLADRLSVSEDAARQAALRLRRRYRELLREEVSRTLADDADVEEEIRGLFAALGS